METTRYIIKMVRGNRCCDHKEVIDNYDVAITELWVMRSRYPDDVIELETKKNNK